MNNSNKYTETYLIEETQGVLKKCRVEPVLVGGADISRADWLAHIDWGLKV